MNRGHFSAWRIWTMLGSPVAAVAAITTEPAPFGNEGELMQRLRASDDALVRTELAREGNRRFPDPPDAPARSSILGHSLAELGLTPDARGAADDAVNHYSDSHWVREIEQFTGARWHPRQLFPPRSASRATWF